MATEYEFDFEAGERLLARAIELNPNYAQAHAWLCETLLVTGQDSEALNSCERARRLDPVGLIPNLLFAVSLQALGEDEVALVQLDRTLEKYPDVSMVHFLAAGMMLRLGRTMEAADNLEALGRLEGFSDPESLRIVAQAFPGDVPSVDAISAVQALEAEAGPGLYYVTALYDWAGSEDDAVRVVEDGVAALNPWQGLAAVFPEYDGLRQNSRFQAILRDLGYPNGNSSYLSRVANRAAGSD